MVEIELVFTYCQLYYVCQRRFALPAAMVINENVILPGLKGNDGREPLMHREHARFSTTLVAESLPEIDNRSSTSSREQIPSTTAMSTLDLENDNISICSEDSDEFWDEYLDKMESLVRILEFVSLTID